MRINLLNRIAATALFALLLATEARALTEPGILLDPATLAQGVEIGAQASVLEDGSGKWSVEEASQQAGAFQAFTGKVGGSSPRDRVFWFRLPLSNASAGAMSVVLEINNPDIQRVELFQSDGTRWQSQQLGMRGGNQLSFGGALPTAYLALPAHSTQTLYLRIENAHIDAFPLRVFSPEAYLQQQHLQKLAGGLSIGILLGLFLYNLVRGLLHRDLSNLLMAGFSFATLSASAGRNNDLYWLIDQSPWVIALLQKGMPLMAIVFHALAGQQMFDTARKHQNSHRLLGFYALYTGAWAVGVTAGIPEAVMLTLMLPVMFVATLVFFRLGWNRMRQGYTPAITYLVGTLVLAIAGIMIGVLSTGVFEQVGTLQPICSIVIALSVLIFTIAFGHRQYYERKQALVDEQGTAHDKALGTIQQALGAALGKAVRAPLSDCLGLVQLMRHQPVTAGVNSALLQIEQSGLGLLTLVSDAIDTQRQRTGTSTLEREDTELPAFLEAMLNAMSAGSSLNNQELALILAADVPPQCKVDRQRLREVLLGLLNHGIGTGAAGVALQCTVEEMRAGSVLLQFQVELFGAKGETTLFNPSSRCCRMLDDMGGVWRDRDKSGLTYGFTLPCPVGFPPSAGDVQSLQGMRVGLTGGSNFLRHSISAQLALWGINTTTEDALRRGERAHMLLVLAPPVDSESLSRLINHYREEPIAPRVVILLTAETEPLNPAGPGFRLHLKPMDLSRLQNVMRAAQRSEALGEQVISTEPEPLPPRLRILLAEDDPTSQIVMQGLIRLLGSSVKTCPDGVSALEELASHPQDFDCLILNAEMPIMDGMRCAREIRAREASQGSHRMPILLLTCGDVDHARAKTAGVDSILEKPIIADQLRRQLKKICVATTATT